MGKVTTVIKERVKCVIYYYLTIHTYCCITTMIMYKGREMWCHKIRVMHVTFLATLFMQWTAVPR